MYTPIEIANARIYLTAVNLKINEIERQLLKEGKNEHPDLYFAYQGRKTAIAILGEENA